MKITKSQLQEIIREEVWLVTERLSTEANELKLFIDNDSNLYRQRYMPIIKNLSKKKKSGRYRSSLAPKLFSYLVSDGAKRYVKAYGGNVRDVFPRRIQKELAKEYTKEFEQIYKDQEFDFMK
tara:strand:+ start:274 stop:642 length:369 start_codon:yes stop_codon:yes gene_type:complete